MTLRCMLVMFNFRNVKQDCQSDFPKSSTNSNVSNEHFDTKVMSTITISNILNFRVLTVILTILIEVDHELLFLLP